MILWLFVYAAANSRQGDCLALLSLLRQLELVHQDVRESLFQDSLPTNRQRLYRLLRNIEVNGGWPYIQRMRLTALLKKFPSDDPLSGQAADPTTEAKGPTDI